VRLCMRLHPRAQGCTPPTHPNPPPPTRRSRPSGRSWASGSWAWALTPNGRSLRSPSCPRTGATASPRSPSLHRPVCGGTLAARTQHSGVRRTKGGGSAWRGRAAATTSRLAAAAAAPASGAGPGAARRAALTLPAAPGGLAACRYKLMKAYMPTVGTMGLDMMFRTCTIQVSQGLVVSTRLPGPPPPPPGRGGGGGPRLQQRSNNDAGRAVGWWPGSARLCGAAPQRRGRLRCRSTWTSRAKRT